MQKWYSEHIIESTRRQLIVIVCPNNEQKRTTTGIIFNDRMNYVTEDNQKSNRYSIRSSFTVPTERLPRFIRRKDLSEEEDDDNRDIFLLKSKSESKLRCLTTKRKSNINIHPTKSETIHLPKPFNYPNDTLKLDSIIESFESIDINHQYDRNQYRNSLKILSESDEINKSYISIKNLKDFKDSCLLYNVTCIK